MNLLRNLKIETFSDIRYVNNTHLSSFYAHLRQHVSIFRDHLVVLGYIPR